MLKRQRQAIGRGIFRATLTQGSLDAQRSIRAWASEWFSSYLSQRVKTKVKLAPNLFFVINTAIGFMGSIK
jgi:hypothetical protein